MKSEDSALLALTERVCVSLAVRLMVVLVVMVVVEAGVLAVEESVGESVDTLHLPVCLAGGWDSPAVESVEVSLFERPD